MLRGQRGTSVSAHLENASLIVARSASADPRAAAELLPLVYEELRRLAAWRLSKRPPGRTLQPTALVHETYMRLVRHADPGWNGRAHFFGAAAMAMRNILVERAIHKAAARHGGGRKRLSLDQA